MQDDQGLIIDWASMPTYNTIMCVAVGAALCSITVIGRDLLSGKKAEPIGWALNLGVLGLILFLTGLHMTLTWPLAKYFPFDNIVFGEPSLALGTLLLAFSLYFWKQSDLLKTTENPLIAIGSVARHMKYFFYGMGLALIGIAVAGVKYQLFAAPPEEPISGQFADYPMVEAIFISGLWALTGIAALLMPSVFSRFAAGKVSINNTLKVSYVLLYGLGLVFLIFGAFNYFTHIGLIVNTMA
ncbi:DUF981 family protein [Nonlabens antarcticus]|uniref:DUF981 family protein n=1 Tax=Nonlabens antarcticus TaxID=392714 RepID=UPI001891A9F4|nr:DUF981 family protein [Nonlabens antarcticus]